MIRLITSLQHPLVKHLVKLRKNSDYRDEHRCVVIAGLKLVKELSVDNPIKVLIATEESLLSGEIQSEEKILVTEGIMQKISGMPSPEGIAAEFSIPSSASLQGMKRVLALDEISDPGNLGALLRTALALKWEGAFLIGNGCDPYHEKALRAARGATFRLPLRRGNLSDLKDLIQNNQLYPLVADIHGKPLSENKACGKILLVLGNEAHGPSQEIKEFCHAVAIPMCDKMESLNVAVAGAIFMYALSEGLNEPG